MVDAVRVVTMTEADLTALLERTARRAVELALVDVLPAYSQQQPPPGVSARALLAACRAGCPHTRKGRTVFVEREAWKVWTAERPLRPGRAPVPVTARQHPAPANTLDPRALLEKARRR